MHSVGFTQQYPAVYLENSQICAIQVETWYALHYQRSISQLVSGGEYKKIAAIINSCFFQGGRVEAYLYNALVKSSYEARKSKINISVLLRLLGKRTHEYHSEGSQKYDYFEFLNWMKEHGTAPNDHTYSTLIIHLRRPLVLKKGVTDTAIALIRRMKEEELQPTITTISCLFKNCIRDFAFVERLRQNEIAPPHILYNGALKRCLLDRQRTVGVRLLLKMNQMRIDVDPNILGYKDLRCRYNVLIESLNNQFAPSPSVIEEATDEVGECTLTIGDISFGAKRMSCEQLGKLRLVSREKSIIPVIYENGAEGHLSCTLAELNYFFNKNRISDNTRMALHGSANNYVIADSFEKSYADIDVYVLWTTDTIRIEDAQAFIEEFLQFLARKNSVHVKSFAYSCNLINKNLINYKVGSLDITFTTFACPKKMPRSTGSSTGLHIFLDSGCIFGINQTRYLSLSELIVAIYLLNEKICNVKNPKKLVGFPLRGIHDITIHGFKIEPFGSLLSIGEIIERDYSISSVEGPIELSKPSLKQKYHQYLSKSCYRHKCGRLIATLNLLELTNYSLEVSREIIEGYKSASLHSMESSERYIGELLTKYIFASKDFLNVIYGLLLSWDGTPVDIEYFPFQRNPYTYYLQFAKKMQPQHLKLQMKISFNAVKKLMEKDENALYSFNCILDILKIQRIISIKDLEFYERSIQNKLSDFIEENA